jgi:hypothetical protein
MGKSHIAALVLLAACALGGPILALHTVAPPCEQAGEAVEFPRWSAKEAIQAATEPVGQWLGLPAERQPRYVTLEECIKQAEARANEPLPPNVKILKPLGWGGLHFSQLAGTE